MVKRKATRRAQPRRVTTKAVSFLVRDLDAEMWAAVKRRADAEGRSLKWVAHELFFLYANQDIQFD